MGRFRRPVTLADYSSILDTAGEIRVGAYARRQWRRRLAVAVVGLLLIAAAPVLYFMLRPGPATEMSDRYPVRVRCITCKHEFEARVTKSQSFPLVCPRCQERSCKPLWKCRDCGASFLPDETAVHPACPNCRSSAVGTAASGSSP